MLLESVHEVTTNCAALEKSELGNFSLQLGRFTCYGPPCYQLYARVESHGLADFRTMINVP